MNKQHVPDLSAMAEKWPSPYVARERIRDFTGGAVSSKYMANCDSEGRGVKGRIRLNGKIIYPVSELIEWLQSKATKLD